KPGLGIKALPQRGVIAGELKLRRPAQLQHDRLGSGRRMSHPHHRQRSGASHHSRHRASHTALPLPCLYVSAKTAPKSIAVTLRGGKAVAVLTAPPISGSKTAR